MIDTKEFVRELKRYGVIWCEEEHTHLIGNEVLTNKDMIIIIGKLIVFTICI